MFDFFTSHFEQKRKKDDEIELKKALAKKISSYKDSQKIGQEGDTEYTEIMVAGRKVRVESEHITLQDVADEQISKNNTSKHYSQVA